MSDLKSRYDKSPELFTEPPEPAPAPEPTAEEVFLQAHPDLHQGEGGMRIKKQQEKPEYPILFHIGELAESLLFAN